MGEIVCLKLYLEYFLFLVYNLYRGQGFYSRPCIFIILEMILDLSDKKIDIAKRTVENHMDFLQCPLCSASFGFEDSFPYSLKCKNNHTYDISRKGYINLFNGYTKITKTYDKILFSARKIISAAGLYDGLCQKLYDIIKNLNPVSILDAGCGCGNLTVDIFQNTAKPSTFAVDLSKDGIDFAASDFCSDNLLWIVGNLNNLPLSDNSADIILNIMSPANYAEFIRVLKPDGILLKVLPDSDYLKELRHFIYKENDKNEYSNKDVLSNLAENMTITDMIDVKYKHKVKAGHISSLFDMTPLTSSINEREKIKNELTESTEKTGFEVSLAFKIAVCKKTK